MYIIALTGGIATGKSTVANYLLDKDYPVIDTDLLSRKVVEPAEVGLKRVVETFGKVVLTAEGELNRSQLAAIIFNDEDKKETLNAILHPLIFEEVDRLLELYRHEEEALVFVDVPLLFEIGRNNYYDEDWLVYTKPELQLERLIKRNAYSQEEATARINSQMPIDTKIELADIIIDNSGTVDETYRQLDIELNRLNEKLVN
ncbi:dephospho-CoA kinase [Fundicoccus sp. Sow4_H7]|uniref:dephospho-CoA kinase n=1 Tax=Fundicoccus sp. Sow4_H7 TaxID=3438784 RepID=UPI003F8F99CA